MGSSRLAIMTGIPAEILMMIPTGMTILSLLDVPLLLSLPEVYDFLAF